MTVEPKGKGGEEDANANACADCDANLGSLGKAGG